MNIFYLDKNIKKCAQYHCDSHILKMIVEYSQILSTAHRYLDGEIIMTKSKNNRNLKYWKLSDYREDILYKCTHYNHPSTKWARQTDENYKYLYNLLCELHKQYERRYKKYHASKRLLSTLKHLPNNICSGGFYQPPQAMPEDYKNDDSIKAYRSYYKYDKIRFAKWKNSKTPSFMN